MLNHRVNQHENGIQNRGETLHSPRAIEKSILRPELAHSKLHTKTRAQTDDEDHESLLE